jgi:hypothetical protein
MAFDTRDAWGERLARSLGFWGTVGVAVGVSIGSGIFRVPAEVAGALGRPGPMLLAWVLGGVIAVCGALSFAELAGALPRSGGLLAWLLEAYGPMPAFLFAWAELVVLRGAALGGIATIFADYLGYFAGYGPERVQQVAGVAILAVGELRRDATCVGGAHPAHHSEVRRHSAAGPPRVHRPWRRSGRGLRRGAGRARVQHHVARERAHPDHVDV